MTGATTSARTVPTDEEMAAIAAAIEVCWPRPGTVIETVEPPLWRFAGRWWTRPIPIRRKRPY